MKKLCILMLLGLLSLTARAGTEEKVSQITGLWLEGGNFVELEVKGCEGIKTLNCSHNKLKTLKVIGNENLQTLDCSHNQLTTSVCIGESVFESTWDVYDNKNLQTLNCNNNRLTSLDVRNNEYLQTLNCSHNQLEELDVVGCSKLQVLHCENNQLTKLDVRQNSMLQDLICSHNQLIDLQIDENALQKLDARYNHLLFSNLEPVTKAIQEGIKCRLSPQTDTVKRLVGDDLDLSIVLNGTETQWRLTNSDGTEVEADAFTTSDGVFNFSRTGDYRLHMTNPAVRDENGLVEFIWVMNVVNEIEVRFADPRNSLHATETPWWR